MKKVFVYLMMHLVFIAIDAEYVDVGLIKYSLNGAYATVSSYLGGEEPCVIPSTISYNGLPYTVNIIGEYSFRYKTVTKVTLPETITKIEQYAFGNCKKINELVIPKNVTEMDYKVFDDCTNLRTLIYTGQKAPRFFTSTSYTYVPDKQEYSHPSSTMNSANIFEMITFHETEMDYTGRSVTPTWTNNVDGWTAKLTMPTNFDKNVGEHLVWIPAKFTRGSESFTTEVAYRYKINPVGLTASVVSTERYYGDENPEFQVVYSGFKGSDNASSFTTPPTVKTNATPKSTVGEYTITISGGVIPNYTITYVPGTLTVKKTPLNAKVADATKVYATSNPTFKIEYQGLKNSETQPAWSSQPTIQTEATKSSPAGEYPITASGGVPINYLLNGIEPGTLTITPAPLTIKAGNASRLYYEDNPQFTYTCTGFVNGDTYSSLNPAPQLSTTAQKSSSVGTYPIKASNAKNPNYTISYEDGTLIVTQRTLQVKVGNYERPYHEENPDFAVIYNGFMGNDNENSLTKKPTATTTATINSNTGTYSINVSGGEATNYKFAYTNGTLTISKAEQTLSWEQDLSGLKVNDQVELKAIASSGNQVSYSLDGASGIAEIYTSGSKTYLDCKKEGTIQIAAVQSGNSNYYSTQRIRKSATITGILATGISLNKSNIELQNINETIKLVATITPENATNKEVKWTSSNTSVAAVDNYGTVTAKGTGNAVIKATTQDGTNLSATCNVSAKLLVDRITLNYSSMTLYLGQSSTLVATITPSDAFNSSLLWESSDPTIASVDQNGNVTAHSLGTTIITTKSTDGSEKSASCTITVKAYAESLTIDKTEAILYPSESIQLQATILPDYASNKTLNWSSSNSSIASVTNTGLVTANSPGSAVITVRTTDGSGLSATCVVTVLVDNGIIMEEVTHIRGDVECISNVALELINKESISAVQFDMTLPIFLRIFDRNGYPDVWLDEARKTRTHTVEVNEIGTNKYRFIISSSTNRDLNGNSGDLVHMNLVFDTIHPSGNYYINLSNIVLTESNETEHRLNNVSSIVKLQYLLGDANADATVDVADYVATAAKILNKPTPVFYQDAANVNGDGNLNVTDLVGITNIALGVRDTEIRPAPTLGESYYSPPVVHATAIDNNVVSFSLDNEMPIAGMQMDLILPEGMTIQDATLQGRANNHQLSIATLTNGHIRLLISAFNDFDIMPGEGDILTIALGSASGAQADIIGQSIIATTRDLTTYKINPVNLLLDVSCIGNTIPCNEVRIYTENGHIIIESPSAGTAQLVMVNGITRPLTVNSGQNVFQAERGYYIVRYNGQTAKVKL